MKIKQTILAFVLLVGFSVSFMAQPASAATCAGVETLILGCPQGESIGTCSDGSTPVDEKCENGATYTAPDIKESGIWGLLMIAVNILSAGIGVVAVGGVVYGSILYTSAGGDVAKVKKAKETIMNVAVGLIMYALLWSFLNYIIPGGLF